MRSTITVFLVLLVVKLPGQSLLEYGFGSGPTIYFGDLGNEKYVPISEINHGITISLKKNLHSNFGMGTGNHPFAVVTQLTWHRIGYDETRPLISGASGNDLRNFRRGLNFKNDLFGFNLQLTYTFYPWPASPLGNQKLALYFFAGPGIFYSNPRADLFRGEISLDNRYHYWTDGTLRDQPQSSGSGNIIERDGIYETSLRQWLTEGQSVEARPGSRSIYGLWQVGFPHGGGLKFGLNKHVTLQLEACFYDFLTDFLDDASHRYATKQDIESNFSDVELQMLARYISDPSGWGSDGTEGPATSPRGNPKKWDWINFFNFQVSIKPSSSLSSYKAKRKRGIFCSPF